MKSLNQVFVSLLLFAALLIVTTIFTDYTFAADTVSAVSHQLGEF